MKRRLTSYKHILNNKITKMRIKIKLHIIIVYLQFSDGLHYDIQNKIEFARIVSGLIGKKTCISYIQLLIM